nr:hypothetical protein Iba_chr01bCG5750 [Ipomoea batatas]
MSSQLKVRGRKADAGKPDDVVKLWVEMESKRKWKRRTWRRMSRINDVAAEHHVADEECCTGDCDWYADEEDTAG